MQWHSWLSQEGGCTGLSAGCQACQTFHSGQNSLHGEWCLTTSTAPPLTNTMPLVYSWPLCTAPGLQKPEAIGKITLSSRLSKPYLIHLELS